MCNVRALNYKLLFCSLMLHLFSLTSSTNYCEPDLCGGSRHIACNNKGALSWDCARDAKLMPINNKLKSAILAKHNELRNKIASGSFADFKSAARMATMKWNSELAMIASLNVKQCHMEHDQCRNTAAFQYAGQNLAYTGWYGQTLSMKAVALDQIVAWFNEYRDTSSAVIDDYRNPRDGSIIGHFTQMIQEKATDVGCAILRQTKNGYIEQYMACNYARGNILETPVYRTTSSRAGTKCQAGTNPTYSNLCSPNEKYDVNSVD